MAANPPWQIMLAGTAYLTAAHEDGRHVRQGSAWWDRIGRSGPATLGLAFNNWLRMIFTPILGDIAAVAQW